MEKKEHYAYVASYCAAAERCKQEVAERLKKVAISSDEIEEYLDLLEQDGYINELRYAQAYARDKFRFNKWGKIKISYMLQSKRLPSSIIHEALDEIDPESYLETLFALLQSKARTTKSTTLSDKKAKLYRFAASRGFESEAIQQAFKQLTLE